MEGELTPLDERRLGEALRQVFGFESLRAGQDDVARRLLLGRSSLAIFPTGGGKSLCYQLPALLMDGVTLVVSPLLALMREQVDGLRERGVAAARMDSTMDLEEVKRVYDELLEGKLVLLYVAPERFANERFRKVLAKCRVAMLAVDEAHCISEWGHNFRPDYLKLGEFAKANGIVRCLALTATATPEVADDIRRAFGIEEGDVVSTGFRRENLALRVTPCEGQARMGVLAERLREVEGAAIVYVTLQRTAEEVADGLRRGGFGARAYHAGMRAEARAEVQELFMRGEVPVVVATIAFGMGIDKADIRAVFHYNLPKTLENYVQEVGRAGRDGEEAHCEVLACLDDRIVLENFIFGDTPGRSAIKSVLEHVLLLGGEFDISFYDISRGCDVKVIVVETLLAYLELGGWIEARGSFSAEVSVRFLRGEREALAGYSGERQVFLEKLFALGKWGRVWLIFDLREAAERLQVSFETVRESFEWLEAHGDVVLKWGKIRKKYRLLRDVSRGDLRVIGERMSESFQSREERDAERLEGVIDFLREPGCLVLRLLRYFGEEDERACGKCSSCLSAGVEERVIPGGEEREIEVEDLEVIQAVAAERQAGLRTPRQMARFLCGLASPASTAGGLKKHRAFGLLEGYCFEDVLVAVEALGRRAL